MLKKIGAALAAIMMLAGLAGCTGAESAPASSAGQSVSSSVAESAAAPSQPLQSDGQTLRIAGLKGPTTMGMVKLAQEAEEGLARHDYQVEMFGTPDEIVPKLVSGEVDAAAIPANLAAVLYQNTQGAVQVAAINTLGVLYLVETGDSIQTVQDLKGKTIYSTGKGTTPEFVLDYILRGNGLVPGEDVMVEYKSEATEVAAMLAEGGDAVAVLPQPYVTAVQMQNEKLRVALNLTEEWDALDGDGGLVTGVLVARKGFIEENGELFEDFLQDYQTSIEWVRDNPAEAAPLVANFGIVEKAPVAEKALPACNLTYLDGPEMQAMLEGYLGVLYAQKPEAVGGQMPGEDFYYGV